MFALKKRGLSMLQAKTAIEDLLRDCRVVVELPMVEDPAALAADLAGCSIAAAPVPPPDLPDVRALRERLHLSREQFALRYGLEVETIRNWETGRRAPDTTARSYLRAISNAPEQMEVAYAPTPVLVEEEPISHQRSERRQEEILAASS